MSPLVVDHRRIEEAGRRIRPHVVATPLRQAAGPGLWFKCENQQLTGSFKVRGALNRILALEPAQVSRGIVAASAGNHGQGVAFAARLRGAQATIVVPRGAVARKVEAIRSLGAQVIEAEGGYAAAEAQGLRLASQRGAVWVSPYNDPWVVAGQGTIGTEILEQMEGLPDAQDCDVYVPVGGGGLICGIGIALQSVRPPVRVIGVQPEGSPYLHAFFHRGTVEGVRERATLADGLAGAVEEGAITFQLMRGAVDDMQLVSEEEIRSAIRWAHRSGETIEPSAAVALAAALAADSGRPRLVVLSGGNIDPQLAKEILAHG